MADDIPKTMLAWRKHSGSVKLVREEVPVPECPECGYLIKMEAAGLCHTDYSMLTLEPQPLMIPNWQEKYNLGHEPAGRIIAVGSSLTSPEYAIGDRVASYPAPGCTDQNCQECTRDLQMLCRNSPCLSLGVDGCFAPYLALSPRGLAKIPDNVSTEAAATATDAALTPYNAVHYTAQTKPGEKAFVFGLGGLGLNMIQILREAGAEVYACDKRDESLAQAVKFGVPRENLVPVGEDAAAWVLSKGLLIDVSFDLVGLPPTFTACQTMLRTGGRLILIGAFGAAGTLPLSPMDTVMKKTKILVHHGGFTSDLKACLELMSEGKLISVIETRHIDNLDKVMEEQNDGKFLGRVVLTFD